MAAVIPLSLLATFLGLTWVGIPANLLSLGAMDFGIIMDGAVIVVENVFRRLTEEHGAHEEHSRLNRIMEAAVEVGRPTLFSMLIIIAAHIPIFTLQRHEGRIFAPMAWSVTSALVGSLILSLTVVPLACYWFLRHNLPERESALVRACKAAYEPILKWCVGHRRTVIGCALVAFAASTAVVPKLGTEFLPELNEGSIWINVPLPASLSISQAQEQTRRFRAALLKIPEVSAVFSKAGRPEDGTDPKLVNMCEMLVDVKPESQWRSGMCRERLLDEMEAALAPFPGIEPSFSMPIRDNVLESISQIDGQIVIKVFGEDLKTLRENAERVLAAVRDVRGVRRAFIDRLGDLPQLNICIDREAAARYGLNISDIQDVIETGLGGKAAATGISLSVSAAIGFIALFGQAVLNGVVMVTYFNQLRSAGLAPEEAVLKGSLVRLRTVLMTGLLAMLGLLPMALSTGIGSETQKPLAVVVIGGLVTATLLTLIALPTLYLVFQHGPKDRTRRQHPPPA